MIVIDSDKLLNFKKVRFIQIIWVVQTAYESKSYNKSLALSIHNQLVHSQSAFYWSTKLSVRP